MPNIAPLPGVKMGKASPRAGPFPRSVAAPGSGFRTGAGNPVALPDAIAQARGHPQESREERCAQSEPKNCSAVAGRQQCEVNIRFRFHCIAELFARCYNRAHLSIRPAGWGEPMMSESDYDFRNALIFQGLSDDELVYLDRHLIRRPFKSGDSLLETGRPAPGVFVIGTGLVTVVITDEVGHEREVATLGRGECVGEIAIMTGEPCSATVRAVTEGDAQLLERDDFLELVERYPGLWRNMGRILGQRLARTSRQLSRPSLANTVGLVTDCPEDTSAALAVAVAHSVANKTGRRVLLIDARSESTSPLSTLSPGRPAPTLAAILHDRSLVNDLQAPADGDGLPSVRLTSLASTGQRLPSEGECVTALELLSPFYDLILLLDRCEGSLQRSLLYERVRSLVAVVTNFGEERVPAWLEALLNSASVRKKLEVAIVTGEGRIVDRGAVILLEEIETRLNRTAVRLPFTSALLQGLIREPIAKAGRALQKGIDRLARNIGQTEVGLALGAGAAKGFAHIGVLKTLVEHSIPIDYIAGCSIGAIVGAMYAGGMPFEEIEERMQGADRKVRRWHLPLRSVWSDAGLKDLLRDPAPTARFRDLQTPFAVVATDVATGREIVINKGLIWRAVQASASVPGIFPPTLLHTRHLVDGGLVNPVPSQTARELGADIVIAVDLMSPSARTHHMSGPVKNSRRNSRVPNLVEMLWRANEIMQEEVTLRSAATADITIEPQLGRVRWSDFSHRGREFIALGERATLEKIPELERLLPGVTAAG